MRMVKQIRDNAGLRESFMDLAHEIFGISFCEWYKNGFWSDKYIPYVIEEEGRVIANASVNIIDAEVGGEGKRYIQIGTVMTHKDYRKRGFARSLLEEIISDWKNSCDMIYLYANDTVLNFYPKFGFKRAEEYQYKICVESSGKGDFKKSDMDSLTERIFFKRYYLKSNPFSEIKLTKSYELLMFYCGGLMKDNVYYSEKYDLVCIMQDNGESLTCFDIFGNTHADLYDVLKNLDFKGRKEIFLGFTPENFTNYECVKIENDDYLFVLPCRENIFEKKRMMMPLLSHA